MASRQSRLKAFPHLQSVEVPQQGQSGHSEQSSACTSIIAWPPMLEGPGTPTPHRAGMLEHGTQWASCPTWKSELQAHV
eukprot:1146263-Pelagomonas_calceolata.AAC.3